MHFPWRFRGNINIENKGFRIAACSKINPYFILKMLHQGKVLLHEGKIYGNNEINNFNAL